MPAVSRYLDPEVGPGHCTQPKRFGTFGTVFANGIKMSGDGHINTPWHEIEVCCPLRCEPHSFALRSNSNVYAEGISVGRVGDITSCSVVVKGSPNVFANGGGGGGYSQSADPSIEDVR